MKENRKRGVCVWVGAGACSLWNELRLWCQWNRGHCSLGCFLMPGALQAAGTTTITPPRKMGQWSPGEVKGARKCAEDTDCPGPENTPLGEPVPPAITDKPGFLTGPLMKKR